MDREHKTRRQFSKQFKAETIALIRTSGKTLPQICRELEGLAPTDCLVLDLALRQLEAVDKELEVLEREVIRWAKPAGLGDGPPRGLGLISAGHWRVAEIGDVH